MNIRALSVRRGWTRAELAHNSGVAYRTVLDVFSGKATLRDTTIWKLAQALEVSPADLATEKIAEQSPRVQDSATPVYGAIEHQSNAEKQTVESALRWVAGQLGLSEADLHLAVAELMQRKARNGNGGGTGGAAQT